LHDVCRQEHADTRMKFTDWLGPLFKHTSSAAVHACFESGSTSRLATKVQNANAVVINDAVVIGSRAPSTRQAKQKTLAASATCSSREMVKGISSQAKSSIVSLIDVLGHG
jgi:hypothetical protein